MKSIRVPVDSLKWTGQVGLFASENRSQFRDRIPSVSGGIFPVSPALFAGTLRVQPGVQERQKHFGFPARIGNGNRGYAFGKPGSVGGDVHSGALKWK